MWAGSAAGARGPAARPFRAPDDPSGQQLEDRHAAGLARAAAARADHEIAAAVGNRRHQMRDQFRAVAAVAIEKHDDVAIRGLRAGPAGAAIAALDEAQ